MKNVVEVAGAVKGNKRVRVVTKKYKTRINGVCGVATNDCNVKNSNDSIYQTWFNMVARCYQPNAKKRNPEYKGCTVSDEWLTYSNFENWYNSQLNKLDVADGKLVIDKDLLVEGNKVYSESTCVLLTPKVNSFLTNKKKTNKSGYTGVVEVEGNKYVAQCKIGGKTTYLGKFNTAIEANFAYSFARAIAVGVVEQEMLEIGYSKEVTSCLR